MSTPRLDFNQRTGRTVVIVALALLLAVETYRLFGIIQDDLFALSYRYALDYGEGIVWQQVLLMFGPRMYSPSPDLPFIVFHYPPLYHALVRLLLPLGWDPLFAGRLVSVLSTVMAAISIGLLTVMGSRNPSRAMTIGVAAVATMLFVSLNAVRFWGVLMRVDLLAIALGLVGTVVLVRSRCSLVGTTIALLICVGAVFAKQTQLPAGIAVFLVALVRAPRNALTAAFIAGAVGAAAAAALELSTGGFFKNIISYNDNPFNFYRATRIVWGEREASPLVILMITAAAMITIQLWHVSGWASLRARDQRSVAEAVIVLHFVLACLSAFQIVKEGSGNNYFIDLYGTGCILIGFMLLTLLAMPRRFAVAAAVLALTTLNVERRFYEPRRFAASALGSDRLVAQIAAAKRPVMSDNMVLLLRAGKPIIYEPAIVRVLVAGGKWDPAPLLAMIHDHGFEFALIYTSKSESGPLVTAALHEAFPHTEEVVPNLTVLRP